MPAEPASPQAARMLSAGELAAGELALILEVTRRLAEPVDLTEMLALIAGTACRLLRAERCSMWLHDEARAELVLKLATDLHDVRLPLGHGLVGACARERRLINVPDCYADPRFDPATDRRSGFRTRSLLALPMLDGRDGLVGVMQLLNRADGPFGAGDEALAQALAAQCAVALQRVQMTAALLERESLRRELDLARDVQLKTLPAQMPQLPGYDLHGHFEPASQTGGDTYDLALLGPPEAPRLLVVLADATGHGLAPALSITQMHAMLRMALRLGTPLAQAVGELNDQLTETLADDRFITAFVGLLDPREHRLHYVCAGQGPVLLHRAAEGDFVRIRPTSFPLGAMRLDGPASVGDLLLAPSDLLLLLSDGVYEQPGPDGQMFGEARVEALARAGASGPMAALAGALRAALHAFAAGAAQQDDITLVLLTRQAEAPVLRARFERRIDALALVFAFAHQGVQRLGLHDRGLEPRLDFVLEEVFTNAVRHSPGRGDLQISLHRDGEAVRCQVDDFGGTVVDPARRAAVDVDAPLEQREPGGLGLHLIGKLADSIEYRYDSSQDSAQTLFRIGTR
jgi:phosphoserine phosphatase RsbU/P